jgi:hypothetical protein
MKKLMAIVVATTLLLSLTLAQVSTASAACSLEGLTPGFWKNHTVAWAPTGYSPSQTLGSVFTNSSEYGLGGVTLLAALSFGGGSGDIGAAKILLRAAVAAILNAQSPDIDYEYLPADVIGWTNAALHSHDRAWILSVASSFDVANNYGTN